MASIVHRIASRRLGQRLLPLITAMLLASAGMLTASELSPVARALRAEAPDPMAAVRAARFEVTYGCVPSGPTPTPTPVPTLEPTQSAGSSAAADGSALAVAGPRIAPAPRAAPKATPYVPPGIDISQYDRRVPLPLVREAGIRFVFIKATQGTQSLDKWYHAHVVSARRAGIAWGPYHFFDYTADGLAQADHFVDTIESEGGLSGGLPPAVDIECLASLGRVTRAYARVQLRQFVEQVYARIGRLPIVYTSASMWKQVAANDQTFGDLPLWVACWRCKQPTLPAGWTTWAFWQTGSRTIEGIAEKFDSDIYQGSDAQLEQLRGGPFVLNGDADTTSKAQVSADLSGLDGTDVHLSVDGGAWSDWMPATRRTSLTLDGSDGERTVSVQLRDGRGTLGPIVSDSIVLDTTPPLIEALVAQIRTGSLGGARRPVPVRSSWSISDGTSGLVDTLVERKCGDDLVQISGLDAAAAVDDVYLAPNTRCTVTATATDQAGNRTPVSREIRFKAQLSADGAPPAHYSGAWQVRHDAAAMGGSYHTTRTVGARVRFPFRGTDIGLASSVGPDRGRVAIYLDGKRVATVDLAAATAAGRQVVWARHLAAGGLHWLEIRVLGTPSAPNHAGRVDIDGFIFLSKW